MWSQFEAWMPIQLRLLYTCSTAHLQLEQFFAVGAHLIEEAHLEKETALCNVCSVA